MYKDCTNYDVIQNTIPTHDDVFFWAMAILNKTKIQVVGGFDEDLYFVKDGFAGTVRDLSYQIYNTAKLIENSINTDCKLLEEFYTHFNTKLSEYLSKEDFIKLFKDKHIKYVFTFRDKSNRRLKDNPTDFRSNVAKFALLDLDEKMRQISNGELKILQVKSGT